MLIDTTAKHPPIEFWVVTRARVLAGLGPLHITKDATWQRLADGTPVMVRMTDSGRMYSVGDCYTNKYSARDQTGRIAHAEILAERSRHTAKMAKLEQAQRIGRNALNDDQLAAALGPCGK